jgi:hypothetical protein
MKRTMILLATMLLLIRCSTTVNRLDRGYSHIRAMQNATPSCVWNSTLCPPRLIDGAFTRLAKSNVQ